MNLVAIKNVEVEDLGTFRRSFERRGVKVEELKAFEGEMPRLSDFDLLVVLGGPMGAYEEERYPFLREEKELIRRAISEGKKVLGICLGAQLIADALGGRVYRGEWGKEIGWKPVYPQDHLELLFRDELMVFHWHGDTFELPKGAVRMASSAMYRNQAFRVGNLAVGLQFHLEVDSEGVEKWIEAYSDELFSEGVSPEEIRAKPERWRRLKLYGDLFVEYFLRL